MLATPAEALVSTSTGIALIHDSVESESALPPKVQFSFEATSVKRLAEILLATKVRVRTKQGYNLFMCTTRLTSLVRCRRPTLRNSFLEGSPLFSAKGCYL